MSGAPATIVAGAGIPQERLEVYAALVRHGALPDLEPIASDTADGYLRRLCAKLDEKYAMPFTLYLGDFASLPDDEYSDEEWTGVVASLTINTVEYVNVKPFEDALGKEHRLPFAALLFHMTRSMDSIFAAFGPFEANGVAECLRFFGDSREWWAQQGEDAMEDPKGRKPSNLEIRKYVRENGILTPGQFKRKLGAHHTTTKHMPLAKAVDALATLPKDVFEVIDGIAMHTRELATTQRALSKTIRPTRVGQWSGMPQPGLLIETAPPDRDDAPHQAYGVVEEMLEEQHQYDIQTNGFSPNLTFKLDTSKPGAARLTSVLELLEEATYAMQQIVGAFTYFNEELA